MSVLQAALDYHERGWSVIPVSPGSKRPLVPWKRYQDRLATPDQIRGWFRKHPDANVGIVTGEISRLVVVDFDVDRGADPTAFAKRFPTPLAVKTGGGGFHYYFALPEGETIRNSVGEDGIDIRATGGFVVAPPSVHATGQRYRWMKRKESAKAADLPLAFLRARELASSGRTTDKRWVANVWKGVSEGQRNDGSAKLAGYYFKQGETADVVLETLRLWNLKNEPPLPDREIQQVVKSIGRKARPGNAKSAEDRTQAPTIMRLAGPLELHHTAESDGYVTLPVGDHRETHPVRSSAFRRLLSHRFFKSEHRPAQPAAIQSVLDTLEAQALYDGVEQPVFIRVGESAGAVYIDLVNERWEVVEIAASGWRVIDDPPIRFRRAKGMVALPYPVEGGTLDELRKFVNVRDADWVLLACCLVAALRPSGPFVVLVLQGEQGSAKSTLSRVLREIVDPSIAPLRSAPREERDLMVTAKNSWLLTFDNLSHIPEWLSDAFCRLASGGGFATRRLYTDAEEVIFNSQRPILINGITELAVRQDLRDRAVILNLPTLLPSARRDEKTYWAEFEAALPQILGTLYGVLGTALGQIDRVELSEAPRMADFARLTVAAEQALGFPQGSFMESYERNRRSAVELSVEFDPVAHSVRLFARAKEWTGTASELLLALELLRPPMMLRSKAWPSTPMHFSNRLRRAVTNLRAVGVEVSFHRGKGRNRERLITIRMIPKTAAKSVRSVRSVQATHAKRPGSGHSTDDEARGRAKKRPTERRRSGKAPDDADDTDDPSSRAPGS